MEISVFCASAKHTGLEGRPKDMQHGHRLADSAVTSLKHDDGKGVERPVDMYVVH